jgi:regulator of sigma D
MFDDVPAADTHINTWELYAVLVCVRLFGDYLSGGHWRVRTDSTSVEGWLMKGECKDDVRHAFVAEVASVAVAKYFRLTAKHIPGARNSMADALSRCHFDVVTTLLQQWKAAKCQDWE